MTQRVLIDATAARFGGTAYAMVSLARALRERIDAVWVVAPRGSLVASGIDVIELQERGRFELVTRVAWQAVRLDDLARRLGATALLTPSGMLPRDLSVPVVSYLLNPVALLDGGLANRVRRTAMRRTAQTVLVPSRAMRDLVHDRLGVRSHVVPLGVADFGTADPAATGLLCVADPYPHKRHHLVLAAWERLPPPRPALRLIGNPAVSPGAGLPLEHGLSFAQLGDAYRSSALLLLASVRESFAMPVAEAARAGVPAVLSDTPALRETGGPGARFVASDDPDEWARVISGALADRRELAAAARRHGARFTIEAMAEGVKAHLP